MNILVICQWGRNRSKYLASYLEYKGYLVKFGGIEIQGNNPITVAMVDWSDVIVFVHSEVKENFLKQFELGKQRVIILDVEDRVEFLAPERKKLSSEEWNTIQQQYVYSELERQIEEYLPLR